ncbi:hypothetical protein BH10PSE10_BH10PSE10_21570 [soil metagenome]
MHFDIVILVANALWFCAAFVQFSLFQANTVKILIPREERGNPIAPTLGASTAFLGGINLPIGLLSAYLLTRPDWFASPGAAAVMFLFFGCCHLSQTAFNIPVLLRGGRVGVAYWPVLKGPMLRIFVIDTVLGAANLACAGSLASR